jgi:cytochrome c
MCGRNEVTVLVRSIALVAAVVIGGAGAARAENAGAGAVVFKAQCGVCHSVAQGKNMIGPSLFGVVGRAAGQSVGFAYSPANRASRLTWDPPTLDRYLASPQDVVPKTIMPYAGLKDDEQRADLIAYLATLH